VPEDSVAGTGGQPDSVMPPAPSNRTLTPAVAAALVVLAASFTLSVAFVLANGGLDLPATAHGPGGSRDLVAGAPTATPTETGEPSVAPTSAPSALASPEPTPRATPVTTAPSIPATPRPTPAATPHPSSNRYDLLTACPDTPDCWVYVVREGDNLVSIARYFGVPLNVVQERNPWTKTTQLVAGQKLILPTPTR
jgi:hypothetical protein